MESKPKLRDGDDNNDDVTAAAAAAAIHTQLFYSSMDFVRDNQAEPVPEETFAH